MLWIDAAWVQAIGTLIALVIAIVIPNWVHHREQKVRRTELKRQGQAIAVLILPLLRELRDQVDERGKINPHERQQREISVESEFHNLTKDMWLMGPAGSAVLRALTAVADHNRFIRKESYTLYMDLSEEEKNDFRMTFRKGINEIQRAIDAAIMQGSILVHAPD